MLKATHKGKLQIGDKELDCYVLEDGNRVLSSRGVVESLTAKTTGDVVPVIASKRLKPFLSQGLNAVLVSKNDVLIEFDCVLKTCHNIEEARTKCRMAFGDQPALPIAQAIGNSE